MSAVLHHSKAAGTTKLVLMGIAWHLGDDPEDGAWPSQETLARYANTSVRQVRRSLLTLVESGELESVLHDGRGYRPDRRTNRYFIRLDCPSDCDSSISHRRTFDDIEEDDNG